MRKRIIITGATSGIGLETLRKLATKENEIIIACRNEVKARRIVDDMISKNNDAMIHSYKLDLSSFDSIRDFSKQINNTFDYIDILFNNAGLFQDTKKKTEQGFQMTIGVNYIGTYYLTYLLADTLSHGTNPQIINVNSRAAMFGHLSYRENRFRNHPKGFRAYSASKYMQLLWIFYSADDFMKKGIRMNGIHPGDVATGIWNKKNLFIKLIWPILKKTLIPQKDGSIAGLSLINSDLITYGKMYQNNCELMEFEKYDEDKARRLVRLTNSEINKLGYKI